MARHNEALIRGLTRIATPPLCPEIRLHLITPECGLWSAREADLDALDLPPPYWAFCWAGGQVLARYILDHKEEFQNRRILDFGAGGGVEGIAAAMAGATTVLATDIDALAVEALRLNSSLNSVQLVSSSQDLCGESGDWDIVLAGDMFYEQALAERVYPWLETLAARGCRVLIGDPHRGFLPTPGLEVLVEYRAPSDIDPGGEYWTWSSIHELRGTGAK